MASEFHRRAKELFLEVLEQAPERRRGALEEACAGDAALRARVQRLLAAHARAEGSRAWLAEPGRLLRGVQPPPAEEGAQIGDYVLLGEIAAGASGRVYRARQRGLDRLVALKLLRVGRLATAAEVRRFRAEAEAAARLDHPHIVPVYEVGEHDGRHFFSMKLVAGASLAEARERFRGDPRAAARLVAQVARAVHHAHLHGVLHRDLKPSNILLDERGEPHVADFGIAKRLGEGGDATATGWICGTPAYMAPEQAEPRGEVTVACDVYSLGCVLYELVTGRVPFEGASVVEVLRKARASAPPPMELGRDRASRDLETICLVALARDPQKRHPSALALAEELERWLDHRPILARRPTWVERLGLLWRRDPVATALGASVALLVVLLAVGASGSALALRRHLERAQEAEREATERLRSALLEQARALRRTLAPGRRRDSLALLASAAAIRPGPDLRDEAITCLGLEDLRLVGPLPGEADVPGSLAFDGALERAARVDTEGRIRVASLRDGSERMLPEAGAALWVLQLSDDGRRLVARLRAPSPEGADLQVWDLAQDRVLLALASEAAAGVSLSGDGARLAVGGERCARVHDLAGGAPAARLDLRATPDELAFDPRGRRLAAAGGEPALVDVLDVASGERLLELGPLPTPAGCLAWSGDGSLLAVGCLDGRTLLFDARDGSPERVLQGHQAEVVDVLFGADGLVATYSWDETSRIWQGASGAELLRIAGRVRRFSGDGRGLVIATAEGVGLWTFGRGAALAELHGHRAKGPMCLDADARGERLATGASDGTWLWDLRARRLLGRLDSGPVRTVAFDPAGADLWTSGDRGLLRWALGDGQPEELRPEVLVAGLCEHAALSADGRRVAVVQGHDVLLPLASAGGAPARLDGFRGIDRLSFHAAGELLAAGSWRGDGLRVWDLRSGEVVRRLLEGKESVRAGFSPDGARLAAGTPEHLRTWRLPDWEPEHVLPRQVAWGALPGSAAISHDGGLLAHAVTQRTVELLDLESGELLARLEDPEPSPITAMLFLPGRRTLAVATSAQRVLLWDLEALDAELRALGLEARLALRR